MKLGTLEPRWIGYSAVLVNGISFLCPHCKTQRLAIHFDPPIDPENWWPRIQRPTYEGMSIWTRTGGDTFETLSISPSINAAKDAHWHGVITNGEAQ